MTNRLDNRIKVNNLGELRGWGKRTSILALISLVGLLCGCGLLPKDEQPAQPQALMVTRPQPLTEEALSSQASIDMATAQEGVPGLDAELSLEEAIARALKYNLSRRERILEEALSLRQLDATKFEMLPSILAKTGYLSRDNDNTRLSRNQNGELAPNQFVSQERTHELSELGLSWSLLDVGMGYYSSVQDADRLLIAAERRRKTTHLLMQDVRAAFWRALVAQRVENLVADAVATGEQALVDSRKSEKERIADPVDALRYQRQLLENLRLLEDLRGELSTARVELFRLINAPLNSRTTLLEPTDVVVDPELLKKPIERLEEDALLHSPDLRIGTYDARIARVEARKTLLRLFPDLGFSYNINYDTDSYLINNRWNQASLQLSFNLMNLLAYPTQKKMAEAGVKLADLRRVTAQAAVLAQVHLARLELIHAERLLARAQELGETDARLFKIVRSQARARVTSKLEETSSATSSILSLMRFYQAKADAQAAEARLLATLGEEPLPGLESAALSDLPTLISILLERSRPERASAGHRREPVELLGVRHTRLDRRIRYVLDLSQSVSPVSFEIPNPRRLVLEFENARLGQGFVSPEKWPAGIPAPRHRAEPGQAKVHLVFDLAPEMAADTVILPPAGARGPRVAITVGPRPEVIAEGAEDGRNSSMTSEPGKGDAHRGASNSPLGT